MTEPSNRLLAVVSETLPNAMYRVEIEGGRMLTGHVAGPARALLTRLVAGDAVLVEPVERDAGLCRIVARAPGTRGR